MDVCACNPLVIYLMVYSATDRSIDRLLGFTTLHDSRRYYLSIYLSIILLSYLLRGADFKGPRVYAPQTSSPHVRGAGAPPLTWHGVHSYSSSSSYSYS